MPATSIAIAGFTGMFGRLVTDYVLKDPNVKIRGIVRDKSKVPAALKSDDRVQLFEADSSDGKALQAAVRGTDVCICCYNGGPDLLIDGQKRLIDACVAEKVPRFIASDYSFDVRGLNMGDFPFKDFQLKIIDYLAEKERAGLIKPVHVFNGAFTEVTVAASIGIIDAETDTFTYWATGDEPRDMTTVADSAAFVARVAVDDGASGFIAVRGDDLSIRQMAQIYEKVYGTKVTMKCLGSLHELKRKMIELREAEPGNIPKWLGLHYNYFSTSGVTHLMDSDLGRYPDFKTHSFEDVLRSKKKEDLKNALYG